MLYPVIWNTVSGGGSNSFTTIQTSSGTFPVADSAADTLNLIGDGLYIGTLGDSSTDTVTVYADINAIISSTGHGLYHPLDTSTWEKLSPLGENDSGGNNTVIGANETCINLSAGFKNSVLGAQILTQSSAAAENALCGYSILTSGSGAIEQNAILGSNIFTSTLANITTVMALGYAIGVDPSADITSSVLLGKGIAAAPMSSNSSDLYVMGMNALTSITGANTNIIAIGTEAGTSVTTGRSLMLLGSGAQPTAANATNQVVFGSPTVPFTNFYLGEGGFSTSPQGAVALSPSIASGTNLAGTEFRLAGGSSTGTGTGGSITFQISPSSGSGSSLNTPTTRMTLSPSKLTLASVGAVSSVQTLTDGASIASDWATGNVFTVTLGGNRTLSNPTNASNGQVCVYRLRQDGTGSRLLSLDTKYRVSTDVNATLTTTANKTDYMVVAYHSGDDKFDVVTVAHSL